VLRLSIIIPHRHNDQRLEETLLSVLENRPSDSEVIVVDDGSYEDPYDLYDEVVFVREQSGATLPVLMNAGLMAATSPIICVLMDGMQATAGWADTAMRHFSNGAISAVSPAVSTGSKQSRVIYGIANNCASSNRLKSKSYFASRPNEVIAPALAAGFYRRKVMLAIEGWSEEFSAETSDVELALLFKHLGLNCQCEPTSQVSCSDSSIFSETTVASLRELASLSAANGAQKSNWFATLAGKAVGLVSGKLSSVSAWQAGLEDEALLAEITGRLEFAKQNLENQVVSRSTPWLRAA
jgi:Glycosyl transferase family 2